MLSVVKGTAGSVTFPSGGMRAAQWRGDLVTDIHDATGFDSNGWEENEEGIQRFSGSIAGFLTKGDTASVKPASGSFILQADTGCTLAFYGRVARWSPDVNVNDNGKVAVDVRANGEVTIVWDDGGA